MKKLTLLKIINLCGIYGEYLLFLIFNRKKRFFFPFSVSIELTNLCNLQCPQCPTGLGLLKRHKGQMSMSLFRTIIDQAGRYLVNLFLYFQGEPLLNKSIFEMIDYANKSGVFTVLSTNAQSLDETAAQRLVLSGLDKIIVSVDAVNQQSYETYRVGGSIDKVFDAIDFLNKYKKQYKKTTPRIVMQFLVHKHNENQISEFIQIARQKGVSYELKSMQIIDFATIDDFLPHSPKFRRYQKVDDKWILKRKTNNRCFRVWNSVVFTYDGEVLPCCYDKDAQWSFGNIGTTSFSEIKTNQGFCDFVAAIKKNQQSIEICRNCDK